MSPLGSAVMKVSVHKTIEPPQQRGNYYTDKAVRALMEEKREWTEDISLASISKATNVSENIKNIQESDPGEEKAVRKTGGSSGLQRSMAEGWENNNSTLYPDNPVSLPWASRKI